MASDNLPSFEDTVPVDTGSDLPSFEDTVPLETEKPKKTPVRAASTPAPVPAPRSPARRGPSAPVAGGSYIGPWDATKRPDQYGLEDAQGDKAQEFQTYMATEAPHTKRSDSAEAVYVYNRFPELFATDDPKRKASRLDQIKQGVNYYRMGGLENLGMAVDPADVPEAITVTADPEKVKQAREDRAAEDVPGTSGITSQIAHGVADFGSGVNEGAEDFTMGAARGVDKLGKAAGILDENDTTMDEVVHKLDQEHDQSSYNDDGYARPAGRFVGENLPFIAAEGLAPAAKLYPKGAALSRAADTALQAAGLTEVQSGGDASANELIANAVLGAIGGGVADAPIAKAREGKAGIAPEAHADGPVSEDVSPDLHQPNTENFVDPKVSSSGKLVHETTVDTARQSQHYAEYTPEGGDPVKFQLTLNKDTGSALINVETTRIDSATEHANTVGAGSIREGLSEVLREFPEIKEISGIRKVGDRTDRVERTQRIPASAVDRLRKENAEGTPDVVSRFMATLDQAGEARADQDLIYKQERAEKFKAAREAQQPGSGERAAIGSFAAMKGAHTKADFEETRSKFSQKDIDDLFDVITKTRTLTTEGRISAYGGLIDAMNGKIPQPKELSNLSEAFGSDTVKTILAKRSRMQKAIGAFGEAWNLPKELMATADLSAPLRQGIGLVHRQEYRDAFKAMFGHAISEERYQQFRTEMKSDPEYAFAEEGGLAITSSDGIGPSEDVFASHLGIKLADKSPLVGKPAKAILEGSERAYVGFLNKLRFDTFKTMLAQADALGIDVRSGGKQATKDLQAISNYINVMTGRGGLGGAEQAAKVLNGVFFSPRLISSRLQILTAPLLAPFGKGFIADLPKGLRKEAVKSYAGMIGTYSTAISLASLAGLEVESNPLSSDFGKIKDGDTRIDLGGGLIQFITAGARAIMRESTSVTSGSTRDLTRRGDTPLDADIRFILNKLHPSMSLIVDQQRGSDAVGNKFTWEKALLTRLTPMGIPDIVQTVQEHPNPSGALYSVLGLLGAGLQNFPSKDTGAVGPKFEDTVEVPQGDVAPIPKSEEASSANLPSFNDTTHVEDTTEGNLQAVKVLTGMGLHINDEGIRSLKQQQYNYTHYKGVAKPGESPHGTGNAIDIRIPSGTSPEDIKDRMEAHGFHNVTLITRKHGSGPHWHVQWDSYEGD